LAVRPRAATATARMLPDAPCAGISST
jgi:hypothetical protein